VKSINDAPDEVAAPIREFFPESEWDNAASVSFLESAWQWDAVNDTRAPGLPCGAAIGVRDGVLVRAEYSVSYFQINACNFPGWNPAHFYNVRQNVGTAHALWVQRGWSPWYFSAKELGLLS
jgi:hypothetical protein